MSDFEDNLMKLLGAYGDSCFQVNDKKIVDEFRRLKKEFIEKWNVKEEKE